MGSLVLGNFDTTAVIVSALAGSNNADVFLLSDMKGITGDVFYFIIGSSFAPYRGYTSLAEVLNDATAFNMITDSEKAMNSVGASLTARNVIGKSGTLFDSFKNKEMAIAKYIAGFSRLNPQNFVDCTALFATASSADMVNASSDAMDIVAGSALALNRLIKSQIGCTSCFNGIQSKRNTVVASLANTTYFTKSTTTVGNGAGTVEAGLNTTAFYIPTSCYDDGDTDYTCYSGHDTAKQVFYMARHSGTVTVSTGVSLRGTRTTGAGGTVGNIGHDVYTAL